MRRSGSRTRRCFVASLPRGWTAAIAVMLCGCGGASNGTASPQACPNDSALDYRTFGAPFMRDWCTGCHSADLTGDDRAGAPASVDFDTIAGVRSHLELIKQRAGADVPTMPPKGPPGGDERALLNE